MPAIAGASLAADSQPAPQSWHHWHDDALLLDLRVQPRASRDRIVGPLGQRLKITITAPPVDGKANAHLCRYLGKLFAVPRSRVSVVAGHSGRDKRVRIDTPAKIPAELREFITLPVRPAEDSH